VDILWAFKARVSLPLLKTTIVKILLDIKDNKAAFFMELLKNFSFVKKATPLSDAKADLMQDIREAVEELKQIRKGKLKGIPAKDLLDEL